MKVTYSKTELPQVGDVFDHNGMTVTATYYPHTYVNVKEFHVDGVGAMKPYQVYGLTAERPGKKVTGEMVGEVRKENGYLLISSKNINGVIHGLLDQGKRVALVTLEDE